MGVTTGFVVLRDNDQKLITGVMRIFTNNKLSKGLSSLLKRKNVSHFDEKEQFNSAHQSDSYLSHFNDAQVSEIAELVYLKK